MVKKKIVFISSSIDFIDAFLIEILHKLSQNFDVCLITNDFSKVSAKLSKIDFISIPFKRMPSLLNDISNLIKLINLIKNLKPNLIVTCTPKIIPYGIIITMLFQKKRIHIYTGIYWILFKGLKKFIFKYLDHLNIFFSNKVLFDSQNQIDFFKKYSNQTDKLELISKGSIKGVDLKKFKKNVNFNSDLKKKLLIKKNEKIILYLGRLANEKGIILLLKAFKLLCHQNVKLLLVGRDEMSLQLQIQKQFRDIQDKIIIVNEVNNPEEYLNISDLLCLHSLREGFGIAALEASSCELPIICSDIPGLSEAVIDNYNGIKFKPNDVNDLRNKINEVLINENLAKKLGKQGRIYVAKKYDSNIVLSALYKQIIETI